MSFEDFLSRPGHSYKINNIEGAMDEYETLEHDIVVDGTEAAPRVRCLGTSHQNLYRDVHYDAGTTSLVGTLGGSGGGPGFTLTVLVSREKLRCQIGALGGMEPGSWTAEDGGDL